MTILSTVLIVYFPDIVTFPFIFQGGHKLITQRPLFCPHPNLPSLSCPLLTTWTTVVSSLAWNYSWRQRLEGLVCHLMRNLKWPDAVFAYGGHHVVQGGCCCRQPAIVTSQPVALLTLVCDFHTVYMTWLRLWVPRQSFPRLGFLPSGLWAISWGLRLTHI